MEVSFLAITSSGSSSSSYSVSGAAAQSFTKRTKKAQIDFFFTVMEIVDDDVFSLSVASEIVSDGSPIRFIC